MAMPTVATVTLVAVEPAVAVETVPAARDVAVSSVMAVVALLPVAVVVTFLLRAVARLKLLKSPAPDTFFAGDYFRICITPILIPSFSSFVECAFS